MPELIFPFVGEINLSVVSLYDQFGYNPTLHTNLLKTKVSVLSIYNNNEFYFMIQFDNGIKNVISNSSITIPNSAYKRLVKKHKLTKIFQ